LKKRGFDASKVEASRRGEVWMVVLGMAASPALLGNQQAAIHVVIAAGEWDIMLI